MSHTVDVSPLSEAASSDEEARRRHYAEFSGLAPLPTDFGVVLGNCQAESLRIVMDAPERRFVRVPPVHELTAEETARLHEVVAVAHTVVTQPVRDDYHGLPLGTRQIAAATNGRVLTVPPVRFGGLQPFQASIRIAGFEASLPIVDYHDVRTFAAVAGIPVAAALSPKDVRAVGRGSLDELRRREALTGVAVSDLFDTVTADHARTVNHPGNAVWLPLGARLLATLGATGEVVDPGRPLLNGVHAPLLPEVVEAWELTDQPRDHWIVDGVEIDDAEVRAAHAEWYRANPEFVVAAMDRLAPLLAVWRNA